MKFAVCKVKYCENGKVTAYGLSNREKPYEYRVISKDELNRLLDENKIDVFNVIRNASGAIRAYGDVDLMATLNKTASKTKISDIVLDTTGMSNKCFGEGADPDNDTNSFGAVLCCMDNICKKIGERFGCEYNPYFIQHTKEGFEWETPPVVKNGLCKYKIHVIGVKGPCDYMEDDHIVMTLVRCSGNLLKAASGREVICMMTTTTPDPDSIYNDFITEVERTTEPYNNFNFASARLSKLHTRDFLHMCNRISEEFRVRLHPVFGELGVNANKEYSYRDRDVKIKSSFTGEVKSYDLSLIMTPGKYGYGVAYLQLVDNEAVDAEAGVRNRTVEIMVNNLNALEIAVETFIMYGKELVDGKNNGIKLTIN